MPAPARKLILPKSVSLIEKGPPRVLLVEGKRYVEQPKENPAHQSIFIAGDDRTDSLSEEELRMRADCEERRARTREMTPGNPVAAESAMNTELANARSENAELRRQLDELRSGNEALASDAISQQDRITALERENARLSVLPERVEFEILERRLQATQRDLSLMEGAMGLSGIPVESVVGVSKMPAGGSSIGNYAERLANAKTPEEQHDVISDFQSAVKDGRVKPEAR